MVIGQDKSYKSPEAFPTYQDLQIGRLILGITEIVSRKKNKHPSTVS